MKGLAVGQAHVFRPGRETDGQGRRDDAAAEDTRHSQCQDHGRKGEKSVGYAQYQRSGLAARTAAEEAEHRAERSGDQGDRKGRNDRVRCAADDAAEHIAPVAVRSEKVCHTGRRQGGIQILTVRIKAEKGCRTKRKKKFRTNKSCQEVKALVQGHDNTSFSLVSARPGLILRPNISAKKLVLT